MKEGKTEKESLEGSVLLVIMSFSCPLQESSNRSSFGEDRGGGGLEEAGGGPGPACPGHTLAKSR